MRIQRTSQVITVVVILLTIFSIACAVVSLQLRERQERAYATRRESVRMADQLADGSDRLTAAVRGYAATGDRRFYAAYQKELTVDQTRDKALARLKELGIVSEELALINRAKQNSDALVSLENRAMEAVARTNLTEAIALVYGDEYRQAKESIMQPIAQCRGLLDTRLTSEADTLAKRAAVAGFVAIGSLTLNAVAIVGALLLFYGKRVVNPLVALNQNLRDLVARKSGATISYQNDSSEIGEVARSMESYRGTVDEAERQRWVKTNVVEIAEELQGVEQPDEFGRRLLSKLVPLVGGGYGAFHLRRQDERYYFTGGYGCEQRAAEKGFGGGEGIVGQAAVERKTIFLTDIPADYIRIGSGLGEAPPRMLAAIPITTLDRVLAVVEIASFTALTEQQRALLAEAAVMVSLKLEVLQRNLRTRELLEQVKSTEERTRLILESSAEGIFGNDMDGRMTFVNAAACRMLGFTAEELIGQPTHAAIHHHRPDGGDYPKEECPMFAAYTHGKASRIDDEFLWRKDGVGIPVEYGATPILKDGVVLGAVISFTDITERKRFLAEIERQRATMEALISSIPDLIFYKDSAGVYLGCNGAFAELVGKPVKEIVGQTDFDLFPQAVADSFRRKDQEMLVELKKKSNEEWVDYPDGRRVMLDTLKSPFWNERGELIGILGISRDITKRKAAEEQLQQVNFKADSALDLTKAGYWHIPLDGSGWYNSSERAARIFGDPPVPDHRYTLEHWMEHVRLGDAAAAKITAENFEAALAGKIPVYDVIYAYQRPVDGRVVWIHALGHAIKDASGKPTDMFGVTQDITELKHMEDELRLAMRKAEEATQMKSMFLANMSHEIRTPMNAIIGLSHLALKTPLNPKQRDYVGKVHNAGTSLLAIINDILDFSKIEAGKLDLETTDFKLDEVISSVTTLTAQKAHEKGLEFLAHVAPGIPEALLGDPLRLGQILTNLVNNAVKFTEHGEIRLEIEQLERTGEKVQLKFSVRDTGIGMTEEQAGKLFQAFSQADMSTTRKHGGTGLGLTISRRLVELMGGRIWLESEPGVGSTFLFTVWLGVGTATSSGKIVPEKLAQLRVLVVDDNPAAREILQEPLSTLASCVDTVASGKEALAAIQAHDATDPYDIVFMDWRMPGMDGLQTSRHIKSDETLKHPPYIVLVTAFGREEVREEAERLELDGFLVKPVTKSMIVDTLVNVFAEAGEIAASGEGEQVRQLRGARILLAEDNDINQQIAVELLEGAGAKVQVANNGRIAVETLSNGPLPPPFDVVLMDLQMPELDGYQATAKLRSDPRFAKLTIIAMTAHATIEERQRCLASGMNAHISKPIDPANLFETVGRFYKPSPAPATSERSAGFSPLQAAIESSRGNSPASPTIGELKRPEGRAPEAGGLPSVPGLDAQDGLTRVAGNRKLYLKLLRQFVEQQGPAVEQIIEAMSQGEVALAERLAHTLKGVAGNIGAKSVQNTAGVLEKVIRGKAAAAEVESAKQQTAAALEPLIAQLNAALNLVAAETPAQTSATATQVNPEQSREAAVQLTKLLSEFDPGSADFVETNQSALRPLFSDGTWQEFEKHVQNYSFAGAQAQLEQALKQFSST